jgi:excisionase family DNA binding protein
VGAQDEAESRDGAKVVATGERLLTREELAETLQVCARTVDRMVADEEITAVRLRGSLVRFYLPDVVRQLTARALDSKHGCARRFVATQKGARK